MMMQGRQPATGGPFDPLDLNPSAWYDASDAATITTSGSEVVGWGDKSGNGNDLTQANIGPTNGVATINGLNALRFSGGGALRRTAAFQYVNGTTGAWTAAAVVKKNSNSGVDSVVVAADWSARFSPQMLRTDGTTPQAVASNEGTYTTDNGPAISTNPAVLIAVQTATTIEVFLDGSSNGATTISGGTAHTGTLPMWIGGHSGAADHLDGDLGEVLVIPTDISSTDRADLLAYLSAKWGTP